ncbi:hypothetical protein JW721_06030 [Candidatus Micrarchaeota archaeon]|nr:hypothetical protein [Candidatus Micrarchaeota archaeon]
MDFRTATDEVYRVEQNAKEYVPPKAQMQEAKRPLELSPPDISEMEYKDIISQYMRLEKIISASSMDMGLGGRGGAPSAAAPSAKKVAEVEQEMQKIAIKGAKEAAQISAPTPQAKEELEVSKRLPITSSGAEREEPAYGPEPEEEPKPPEIPAEAGEEEPQKTVGEDEMELPFEEPSAEEGEAPAEAKEEEESWEIPLESGGEPAPLQEAKEPEPPKPPEPTEESAAAGVPFGFEELPDEMPSTSAKPSAKEMGITPTIRIPVPAFLSESPIEKAEAAISRLEVQVGAQMTGKKTKKVDSAETKKRMLELTRELFKERSMNRRAEIKKEIVMLKELLTKGGKGAKAKSGGLPEGSMYSALRSEQDYEFKEALDKVQEIYEENKKMLVSAMDAKRAIEHREPAFEAFSKSMVDLEQGLDLLVDKYQDFLAKKHVSELEKLDERGQATKDSSKLAASLEDKYSREFSSLKNTIGEQIHSQIESTRAVLFESAGDPAAQKLSQVANASEETVFNFLQARDSRTYERYARGEITRAQALSSARRLMAKELGVDEDSINKTFGGK